MKKIMKRLTISSVMQSMCYGFAALVLTTSCANDDTVQEGKQKKTDIPTGSTIFTGTSQPEATTRTAILNHTKGTGASVNWSSTDKIWVKDDAGTWQQSATATIPSAANQSFAKFSLSGTYTGASHDIIYTNTAVTGSQPQVEIKAEQTQSAPNNFDHAGVSGDCGIATGVKLGSGYNFSLNHKASYLCLIPRTTNEYVKRSKLIKVEIMSDDEIAGTYNMATDGTLTLASGGSKTITVITGSGFDIDNSADDMGKNATYAVVAPGTHTFRIRYWLYNTTDHPGFPIGGTVSKIVTLNCAAGSIHDITANLNPHDYDGDHYYLWDAQEQYWKGHEWNHGGSQPTISQYFPGATISSDYAQSSADPNHRYYNESNLGYGVSNPAIHTSCKDLPNVNEMTWYVTKGNPRWDKDELWTTMGHLYKGGMWFKKKSVLQGEGNYNANTAVDGTDWRTANKGTYGSISSTLPSAADAGNYFYLPALGYYRFGRLYSVGSDGFYWSSSAYSWSSDATYCLSFSSGGVNMSFSGRNNGYRVDGFE